eukprot:8229771-Alexandrium_andersonii.AAC.1
MCAAQRRALRDGGRPDSAGRSARFCSSRMGFAHVPSRRRLRSAGSQRRPMRPIPTARDETVAPR